MNSLQNNKFVDIKACDKSAGICIMNTRDYFIKIHTHLQDHSTYRPLTHNTKSATTIDASTLIQYKDSKHIIDKAIMELLLPSKNTAHFSSMGYPNSQVRLPSLLNISGSNGPTNHLSAYITHFILPLTSNLPLHINDIKHFLNLIQIFPLLPSNALLLTADVKSSYTNIPHENGITDVTHFMEKYRYLLTTSCPTPYIVLVILDFILKRITLKFMDTHIHQILGTSKLTALPRILSTLAQTYDFSRQDS